MLILYRKDEISAGPGQILSSENCWPIWVSSSIIETFRRYVLITMMLSTKSTSSCYSVKLLDILDHFWTPQLSAIGLNNLSILLNVLLLSAFKVMKHIKKYRRRLWQGHDDSNIRGVPDAFKSKLDVIILNIQRWNAAVSVYVYFWGHILENVLYKSAMRKTNEDTRILMRDIVW